MATTSTVPARHDKGPSGLRRRGGFARRTWPRSGRKLRSDDIRKVVRGIGKALIIAGVLIFLFVAYQLWGTGIAQARDQANLKSQFNKALAAPPTAASPDAAPAPLVAADGVIGVIKIPRIGVDQAVVEGVSVEDLKKGPGRYPDTPMPGQAGNAAIAGHRTTYGAPFNRLDELSIGDSITVQTVSGTFRYEVFESKIVSPDEVSVLDPTPDNRLTLTTCNPKFSAAERLIVVAGLVGPVAPATPAPAVRALPPPGPRDPNALAGLSGTSTDKLPAVLWGALAAGVWILAWAIGQWWRRWPTYLMATPVFLVVLFVFFENFSRLLPANV